MSHEGDELAGFDFEGDVVKHGFFAVGESHVVKANGSTGGVQRFWVGRFGQSRLDSEHVKNRFHTGAGERDLTVQPAQVLHRRIQAKDGEEES